MTRLNFIMNCIGLDILLALGLKVAGNVWTRAVNSGAFLLFPPTQLIQHNIGPFLWFTMHCTVTSNYSWNGAVVIFMSVCSDDIHMPVTSLLNSWTTSHWEFSLLILCRTFISYSFWTEDHDTISISITSDVQVFTCSFIYSSFERNRQPSEHFFKYY